MYVVVQHRFNDPAVALARGERLINNDGAPAGVRGLQFYPSRDGAVRDLPVGSSVGRGGPGLRRLDTSGLEREHLLRRGRPAGVRCRAIGHLGGSGRCSHLT